MVRWRRSDPEDAFLQATQPAVDLVYNLARRLAACAPDAEDVVQETYLRAWRAWRSGSRPRRVEPWLATICLNVGRDRARWRSRHPESPAFGLEPRLRDASDVSGGDVADEAAVRVDVDAALAALPEPQRIAVILSDMCGLTAREVARVTDCPLGTALARIHRGRLTLAARLRPDPPAPPPDRRGGASDATRA